MFSTVNIRKGIFTLKIFIPIKKDSQRVPGKNFRIFNGEPLYKHTLLKYSKDEVWVDTASDRDWETF